jgi:hypothetical protein
MTASARDVVIDEEQRRRLEAVVRSRTAPIRDVQRARIVLAAADGLSNAAIAVALSVRENTAMRSHILAARYTALRLAQADDA